MSNSTITVQKVAQWARIHTKLQPLFGVAGYQDEPALSITNNVIQEIFAPPFDWKWNRVEMTMFCTQQFKQDYLFAGASAFVLQNSTNAVAPNCGGVGIDLAANNAITESTNTVTVNTLEKHPFLVGQTVYIIGTGSAYDNTYSLSSLGVFSGGWTITATPSTTSFQFTHPTSGLAASGAPGITNYAWLESATMLDVSSTALPQPVSNEMSAVKMLPPSSQAEVPQKVCVLNDLGTGVLKMRLWPVPTQYSWGIKPIMQAKAPLITSLTSTWAPIPDHLSYVYYQGFLAQSYRFSNSPQYQPAELKFQQLIMKALQEQDSEQQMEGISPFYGLLY